MLSRSRFLQGKDTDRLTVREMSNAISAGKVFLGRLLNYTKCGRPIWNYLLMQPLRNKGEWIQYGPALLSLGYAHTSPRQAPGGRISSVRV